MIDLDEDDEAGMEARFEEVKRRFVADLPQRLAVSRHALALAEGDSKSAAEGVSSLYETIHSMCGIAPMLGFPAIGDAARRIDNALVMAFRAKRGLSGSETRNVLQLFERLQDLCVMDRPD